MADFYFDYAHFFKVTCVSRKNIQDANVCVPLHEESNHQDVEMRRPVTFHTNIPLLPEYLSAVLLTSARRPVLFMIARQKEERGGQRYSQRIRRLVFYDPPKKIQ